MHCQNGLFFSFWQQQITKNCVKTTTLIRNKFKKIKQIKKKLN